MELKNLRNEIDVIDDEICKLFVRRMDTVTKVSELKESSNRKVLDKSREREILSRVTQLGGDDMQSYTKELFTSMMSLSRSYQRFRRSEGEICTELRQAMDATEDVFPKRATVACQGIEGAYSQITCDKLFSLPSIMYFDNFQGVFSAVEHGLCRYGILPIENSTQGSVYETYDLMNRHKFYIVHSFKLKISHALLTKPNVKISEIKTIISHQQALSQCSDFLATLKGVTVIPVSNTAVAAKMVAESEDNSLACISSPDCAETYGLDAYPNAVQNNEANYTRFICIAQKPEIYPGSNRISMMLNVRHEPGALYELLARFTSLDINVRKLESRPIPGTDFDFTFYFDIEADLRSPDVLQLIGTLSEDLPSFVFLGSYMES